MAVVSFEALRKSYGRHPAVDGVSFAVEEREVVGLLGPNGSGKSTILRILTGYLRPDAGTVTVDGLDVVRDGLAVRRRIGYVPEDVPLYPHMRVNEFLDFMGRLRGLRGAALRQAIDRAVERLELQAVRTSVIGRLSRGYRQRVSLAQAVLHAPRLLVLDEPTNGLDPRQIIELRGLLRTLAQDCAVLVTSHVLAEIERVADRVAILLEGRLLTLHRLDRAAAGGRFHVTAPAAAADRVVALLRGLPGADVAETGAAAWTVWLPGADAGQRLANALAAAGVATVAARAADSDLETLFLALTGGAAAR